MACRLEDQNKLVLVSVSLPENYIILWDLAQQLRFPRKQYRINHFGKAVNFDRLVSLSQRKGEYLAIIDSKNGAKFQLPRRFKKLSELMHLSNVENIQPNVIKFLSTVGKQNISEIISFIQSNNMVKDLQSLMPLDLFETPGLKNHFIESLEFQKLEMNKKKMKLVSSSMSIFKEKKIVIDEPFCNQLIFSYGSHLLWYSKDDLCLKGTLDIEFGIKSSGFIESNFDKFVWVLLGKNNPILIIIRK